MLTFRGRQPPDGQRAMNFMEEAAQPSSTISLDERNVDQPLVRVVSKKQAEVGKKFAKIMTDTENRFSRYRPWDAKGQPTGQPWSVDAFGQYDSLDGLFKVGVDWHHTADMFASVAQDIFLKMIEHGYREATANAILEDAGMEEDDVRTNTVRGEWYSRVDGLLAMTDEVFDALEGDKDNLIHPNAAALPTQPEAKVPWKRSALL